MKSYRNAPLASRGMPDGIPYIISNETAERFSFYGMRAILTIYMTTYLINPEGSLDVMSENEAKTYFHLFVFAVYFFPIIGALIADRFWGKFKTIIFLSIIYCIGHLALALDSTRIGLLIGLTLIAIGSGGIKPCVSANVGDQFGKTNSHLISKAFGWFYFAINLGAFSSTLLTPVLLEKYGPHIAFGIPGLFMFLATLIFWYGRFKFIHIPPKKIGLKKEIFKKENRNNLISVLIIFLFVSIFWSLFDQTGSSWVLQAEKMDRNFFGVEWKSAQIQAMNPILILILTPLFHYFLYPKIDNLITLTQVRKILIGFFIAALAFFQIALIESWIESGMVVNIRWQLLAYITITIAEILVSITCLEFFYTQAPIKMKSLIMSIFLLSIALGNAITSFINFLIQKERGLIDLNDVEYFRFFAYLMLAAAILFIPIANKMKTKTHIQKENRNAIQ